MRRSRTLPSASSVTPVTHAGYTEGSRRWSRRAGSRVTIRCVCRSPDWLPPWSGCCSAGPRRSRPPRRRWSSPSPTAASPSPPDSRPTHRTSATGPSTTPATPAVAYALDADGDPQGTLEFRVDPVDVEAVAFHDGRLYVADIGDNRERRDFVTVYFFDDAEPSDAAGGLQGVRLLLPRRSTRRGDAAGGRRRPAVHRHQGDDRRHLRRSGVARSGRASTSSSGWATLRRT